RQAREILAVSCITLFCAYIDRLADIVACVRTTSPCRRDRTNVIGAGEGNRTLVCSLGSSALFIRIKSLAAKLCIFDAKDINRLSPNCKTGGAMRTTCTIRTSNARRTDSASVESQ